MDSLLPPRQTRLIPVAVLAALIPLLSWRNLDVVKHLNQAMHRNWSDTKGYVVYTVLHLLVCAALLGCIYRLKPRTRRATGEDIPAKPARRTHGEPGRALFDPLLGLRSLAAAMVFLGHYFLVIYAYRQPATGAGKLVHALLTSCPWGGVWVFFTLSGYLMAKGFATGRYHLEDGSVWRFYRNRFLRIMPLYVGVTVLTAMLVTPAILHPGQWWQLAEILTFDYHADLPLNPNGPLWSVSTEAQFYLLAPFLFVALQACRRRMGAAFPVAIPLLLATGAVFRSWIEHRYGLGYLHYGYTPLVSNLDLFLTGMCLTLLPGLPATLVRNRRMYGLVLPAVAVVIYLSSAYAKTHLVSANIFYRREPFFELVPTMLCVLTAVYILVAESAGPIPISTGLAAHFQSAITRVGVLTYAIYALHEPILLAFRTTLQSLPLSAGTSLRYFPLLALLTWLAAECAYRFVELPFEQRKHLRISPLLEAP